MKRRIHRTHLDRKQKIDYLIPKPLRLVVGCSMVLVCATAGCTVFEVFALVHVLLTIKTNVHVGKNLHTPGAQFQKSMHPAGKMCTLGG